MDTFYIQIYKQFESKRMRKKAYHANSTHKKVGVAILISDKIQFKTKIYSLRDFPGGPVVKTPHSQCRGHGFHPWSGN